jgi:hypothetical protein
MSSRDSASGSSTFHGGGRHINNSGPVGAGTGGGGLAQLLASLVSGAPQTNAMAAPPIPTARPPQAAPGKGSIPGAGNPPAPVPQVPAPGKGSLPSQGMSPAGPFPPPGYTPPGMSPAGPFPAPGYTPNPGPAPYVEPEGYIFPQGYLGYLGMNRKYF